MLQSGCSGEAGYVSRSNPVSHIGNLCFQTVYWHNKNTIRTPVCRTRSCQYHHKRWSIFSIHIFLQAQKISDTLLNQFFTSKLNLYGRPSAIGQVNNCVTFKSSAIPVVPDYATNFIMI